MTYIDRTAHTIRFPDELHRELNLASAAVHMSVNEFVCAAAKAAVETMAEQDPLLAAAFRYLAEKNDVEVVIDPARFMANL